MKEKDHSKIFPNSLAHRLGRWVFSCYSFVVFHTYLQLKVRNKKLLPNEPFIICSNHQSHLDAIILGHVGSYRFSRSALIAAEDYWFDNKKRFFLANLFFNVLPISRRDKSGSFDISDVTQLIKKFVDRKGRCVVILPEGTRSKNGKMGTFKKGVEFLSKQSGLPIVPVYICNSRHIWPKGSFFFKPGKLEVRIGSPIFPKELEDTTDDQLIRNRVLELQDHERSDKLFV